MNKFKNSLKNSSYFLIILSIFATSCGTTTEVEQVVSSGNIDSISQEAPGEITVGDSNLERITDEDILIPTTDSIVTINNKTIVKKIDKLSGIPLPVQTKEVSLAHKTSEASPKHETTSHEIKQATQTHVASVKVFNHDEFDALLRKHVTSAGKVDYNGFKVDRAKLQSYLKDLRDNEPDVSWSKNKKLAYWINMYNANTIELILKNNIPSSIMSINNGKAWDLAVVEVGSKKHSLNQIEHDIIRKQFGDPRIHFACVCAAKSCPKLLNLAYTESNLNAKLDEQTKNFINNSARNQISDGKLVVSSLFDWYASDFGEVNTYIRKYYNGSFKDDKKIEFMDYDWSLNN
jgi:Protein of unknown function, DUF547